MKITIKPVDIKENPKNEVTSSTLLKDKKAFDKSNNRWLFHENGIFSEMIFGRFNSCYCGKVTKPGYCYDCRCRVLNRRKMPNFYIKFPFDLPNNVVKYVDLPKGIDRQVVKNLLQYYGFLYDGEYIEFNVDNPEDIVDLNFDKILIGKEALLELGVPKEWYRENTHNKISIPHTIYRRPTCVNDSISVGPLNKAYQDLLREKERYERFAKNDITKSGEKNVFNMLNSQMRAVVKANEVAEELTQILSRNKRNVIDNELKGQPETGMIRAVMTNNFSLDEDIVLIGSYFVETLYPVLSDSCRDAKGKIDIDLLNQKLEEGEYYVLFNRQPTIGAKSIITMIPRFSNKESEQFVIQANPIVYDGLAADVDGDALNIIALYTKEANQEAKKLLASRNYLEGANSNIRNGILEEFEYVESIVGDDHEW